jgi:hypothetical protein
LCRGKLWGGKCGAAPQNGMSPCDGFHGFLQVLKKGHRKNACVDAREQRTLKIKISFFHGLPVGFTTGDDFNFSHY